MEAPTTQRPATLPGRKRSPSPKSKRQTPPKQHDVQIIEPEPLPVPYKVGQPRLSTFETALVNTLPLTYFSSIWWVGTQTGVWSGVLVYGLRKAISQNFGGEQLRKYYMALAAYWLLNLLSPTKHSGFFRNKSVRNLPMFRVLSSYYPHKNIVTTPLTGKKYFFGMHPHGVLALTLAPSFAEGCGFENELFPQLRIQVCTVDAIFLMPYANELSQTAGMVTNQKSQMVKNLANNKSIANYIGGADEALLSGGGKMRLILKNRMGFVQVCVATGTPLVPCLAFGETALYRQVFHPALRKLQLWMGKHLPISLPVAYNGLKEDHWITPFRPRRVPTFTVFGKPIECPLVDKKREPERFRQVVAEKHAEYVAQLRELHEKWKHLGTAEDQELEILSVEESRKPHVLGDLKRGQERMDELKKLQQYDLRKGGKVLLGGSEHLRYNASL